MGVAEGEYRVSVRENSFGKGQCVREILVSSSHYKRDQIGWTID
jgi:hypothetical protein